MSSSTIFLVVCFLIAAILFLVYAFTYRRDSSDVQQRTNRLSAKFSTDMNRFAARKETIASTTRTNLANQITQEMSAVVGMNEGEIRAETSQFDRLNNLAKLNRNLQLDEANHQTLLDANDLTRRLIGLASTQEMDVATYLELKKKIEMDRLELQRQWTEAEQQLKAGFIFQLQAHQHLALMTEYIGKLYDRSEYLTGQGKDREHKLIEEHIEFMEGDFRERQRLLQTSQQEDIQGSDENSDTSADDR